MAGGVRQACTTPLPWVSKKIKTQSKANICQNETTFVT